MFKLLNKLLLLNMDINDSFQELTLIDPSEWTNIPAPLITAFTIMKKCIFTQMHTVISNNEKIVLFARQNESQFRSIDIEIKSLNKAVIVNDDATKKSTKELSESLKKNTNFLQTNFDSELGFLKKSTEGKFAFIEQLLENSKKQVEELPTFKDLDGKISSNIKEISIKLRKEIKSDVKDTLIDPQILGLQEKLAPLEPALANLRK